MKMNSIKKLTLSLLFAFFIVVSFNGYAQETPKSAPKSEFWNNVQFGGGLGLSVGSGFTDITVAPSAIYNFNDYVSLGFGLQGSYVSSKNNFNSSLVGGSLIALFNPIEVVQLSLEVEEVNVNTKYLLTGANSIRDNYWNTGLFVGVGYRMDNVTVGARYNLLYDNDKSVYSDALMPFIRVYF